MSRPVSVQFAPAATDVDENASAASELWSRITPEFLALVNWSDDDQVIWFPSGHHILKMTTCKVVNCEVEAHTVNKLCRACSGRRQAAGSPPIALFALDLKPFARAYGLCAVPGCERPRDLVPSGLCAGHREQRAKARSVPLADFLAHPDVVPLISFGTCEVAVCRRLRPGMLAYCRNHGAKWLELKGSTAPGDIPVAEGRFRALTLAVSEANECVLRGLPDRVVAELLFGLQQRSAGGVQTRLGQIRPLVAFLHQARCHSIEDADLLLMRKDAKTLGKNVVTEVLRSRLTPETERVKDKWDMTVFGFRGTLRFDNITQLWLREATKIWAYNDIPMRRSRNAKGMVQYEIRYVAALSESLRLQCEDDGGHDPRLLSRNDVSAFLNRLSYLHTEGTVSGYLRAGTVRGVRRILIRMRGMGLTRPGEPLHGLPDEFMIHREDIPRDVETDNKQYRDLPLEVMRHLYEHLDAFETRASRGMRVAVELLIDTGRRPDEVCQLSLDCLERDEQGKPVLIYDNIKANRVGRRLPVTESTAALISEQQERVRDQLPVRASGPVKLFPALTRNPNGTRPLSDDWLSWCHRKWVVTLPEVEVPLDVEVDGTLVTKLIPFDRSKIFLYAYRHTYAQRHADAGVAVDVLCELMDHRDMGTTQGYYRIGEKGVVRPSTG